MTGRVLALVQATWREAVRSRTLGILFLFTVLLFAFTPLLGSLALDARRSVITDLGLFGVFLCTQLIAVFLAVELPQADLARGTAQVLLATGTGRGEWLAGKFLGVLLVVLAVAAGCGAVFLAFLAFEGVAVTREIITALLVIAAEGVLMAGVGVLMGTICTRLPALFLAIGFLFFGHVGEGLRLSIGQEAGMLVNSLCDTAYILFPHLELFRFGSDVTWRPTLGLRQLVGIAAYAFTYATACVSAAALFLRRRDL